MKNLIVFKNKDIQFEGGLLGLAVDSDNALLYAITATRELLKFTSDHMDFDYKKIDADFKKQQLEDLHSDDIVLIDYIIEHTSILIVLRDGRMYRFGVTHYSPESGLFYRHTIRVTSAKLSPEKQDMIAFADEKNELFTITLDGDVIDKSNAHDDSDSHHKPVGVGWGSKETQFFGLDGRPSKEKQAKQVILNDKEMEEVKLIESSSKFQEFRRKQAIGTVIDWCENGQYIATLTYLPEFDKHILKVWNCKLKLQYMSEQLILIEGGMLSYMPNGQFICCAQRRDNSVNDITFFEKNGMIHLRLTLPSILEHTYIKTFSWSSDSQTFALIVNQFFQNKDGQEVSYTPILMLYKMQNYHYYLKYSCHLNSNEDYRLKWDPLIANRVYIISTSGHYIDMIFHSDANYSYDHSTVAVVDENKIMITPMSSCRIPPPMYALTIEYTRNVIHRIATNPKLNAKDMIVITLDGEIICFNAEKKPENDTSIKFKLENPKAKDLFDSVQNYTVITFPDYHKYQNFLPIKGRKLIATRDFPTNTAVVEITLNPLLNTVEFKEINVVSSRILRILEDEVTVGQYVCLCSDGKTLILNNKEIYTLYEVDKPANLRCIEYLNVDLMYSGEDKKLAVISLNSECTLRYNGRVLSANNCTSFRMNGNFLVFTTIDQHLQFVSTKSLATFDKNQYIVTCNQPIESGGVLITYSEEDSQVILQMPRGNLEILHPRVLILSTLTELMDQQRYVEAIRIARRHRLNMNFLADYLFRTPSIDAETIIAKFAQDIVTIDQNLLLLFITELEDVDSIRERYVAFLEILPERKIKLEELVEYLDQDLLSQKTNLVCSYILKSLSNIDSSIDTLRGKLICHLKSKPTKTPDALRIVSDLPKEKQSEALKYILYFTDIDQLFDEALGTYDTNIVLMVAEASHKDPKEYLALLSEFDAIENQRWRCYKIDMHLKRYPKALKQLLHLVIETKDSEKQDLLVKLVCDYRLYKLALKELDEVLDHNDLKETIWFKYGQYLFDKRYHLESGIAYAKALRYNQTERYLSSAIKSLLLAESWEPCLALIKRCPNLPDGIKKVNMDRVKAYLVNQDSSYKFSEPLLSAPPQDDNFINLLIKKSSWHLAEYHSRPSMKDEILATYKTILAEAGEELLLEIKEEFELAKTRLDRIKKLLNTYQERKIDGMMNDFTDTLSVISDTSSVMSDSTKDENNSRSGASSIKTRKMANSKKNRPKGKRITLKEGSRHEDLALILELQKFVNDRNVVETRAVELAIGLYDYCSYREACDIIGRLNDQLVICHDFAEEISGCLWPELSHHEHKYSLYRRFVNVLSNPEGSIDNNDFAVLMRPIRKSLLLFEL